ncbi:transcriptional regulator [Amycolatopsis albispora]|uniref:Transcriptional regulator n=2 Tax=Amycolatopsis albispora TaxID=1804986 RepID=A0A344LK66_9PSEU|nr:GAF and ANTAR domain-containing protein [Amycolatopsis albispora]AXB48440.1 transcriptional regulator [Amycolatopsis albispora]
MPDGPDASFTARFARRLDEVTGALENLARVLDHEEDLDTILDRLCRQAVHAVPGADMASVTLLSDAGPRTAATTVARAGEIDEAQYRAGEGPCLEAARSGQVERVSVAEARSRWPGFAAAVAGVAGYLSAPLFVDEECHGSLNLYGTRHHGFRELDAALLELYTTAAEAALRNARRFFESRRRAEQLREALASRAVIEQAKGIIMGARRVSADEAFALLVARSQRDNVKVRDLAQRFVTEVTAAEARDGGKGW